MQFSILLFAILCYSLFVSDAFTANTIAAKAPRASRSTTCLFTEESENNEPDDGDNNNNSGDIARATVKIDDGGSDLTNRFKYKVNALMGVFDPQDGVDDERQDGNILDALLTFPVRYTFNIVGKTAGSATKQEEYIDAVKSAVMATAGDDIVCKITPRGKNFVKLQCEVEILNAAMINTIYDDIEKLEQTVMRF